MTLLLLAILIVAALSLASYGYCWHDIQGGEPHIISLRQITTIMDRAELNRRFGTPLPGYHYRLAPETLQRLLRSRSWFFWGECIADAACMIGAWRYLMGVAGSQTVGWFVLIAGLCQGINLAWSLYALRKWGHQIREELDDHEE